MKQNRRLGFQRHVDLAQVFVAGERAIDARQGHGLLGIGQFDTDELLGGVQRLFLHAQRRLLLLGLLRRGSKSRLGGGGYPDRR